MLNKSLNVALFANGFTYECNKGLDSEEKFLTND